MTVQYRQSFVAALSGHVLLIVAAIVVSVLPGWLRPKPIDIPVLWLPPVTDQPLQRRTPPPEHPAPPPPAEPTEPRTPDTPPDPLPPRAPDKPPPEPEPVKHDAVAPVNVVGPKPPPKLKPPASNTTSRVTSEHVPVKIGPSMVRTISAPPGVLSHKPPKIDLKGEWDKMIGVNAPIGNVDSVPLDEQQRCIVLIRSALYNAWDQPATSDAGSRPAELEIRLDPSGRLSAYRITQPSGSALFDRTVLLAAKAVPRIEGLTPNFLHAYSRVTIEFKLSN